MAGQSNVFGIGVNDPALEVKDGEAGVGCFDEGPVLLFAGTKSLFCIPALSDILYKPFQARADALVVPYEPGVYFPPEPAAVFTPINIFANDRPAGLLEHADRLPAAIRIDKNLSPNIGHRCLDLLRRVISEHLCESRIHLDNPAIKSRLENTQDGVLEEAAEARLAHAKGLVRLPVFGNVLHDASHTAGLAVFTEFVPAGYADPANDFVGTNDPAFVGPVAALSHGSGDDAFDRFAVFGVDVAQEALIAPIGHQCLVAEDAIVFQGLVGRVVDEVHVPVSCPADLKSEVQPGQIVAEGLYFVRHRLNRPFVRPAGLETT